VLLRTFYEAALVDDRLGPVFQTAEMRLETHLPRIVAFWEVTLLGTNTYSGSPLALHRQAAAASGLGQAHFTRWLALWERTVATLFTGPIATRAVTEAQRMAVGMLRDLERHPAADTPGTSAIGSLRDAALDPSDAS
jgi:hemoglobin